MHFLQRVLLIALFLFSYSSPSTTCLGLFANVINVAESDTLNVRVKPDYHSKKTGALPLDAFVGVDYCKKMGRSTWCKVFHIMLRDYDEFGYDAKPGWVNARYLKFHNRGYVIIDGKPNCDYALGCKNNKYEVVVDYTTNSKTNNITSLKTQWIDRRHLRGSSNFGAVGDAKDGYCTNGTYIEEFLQNHKEKKPLGKEGDFLQKKIRKIVSLLNSKKTNELTKYIHPKNGIVLTWSVRFGGKEDLTFTRSDVSNIKKNRFKKLNWGYTYGKGDKVSMSLYYYMSRLTKPLNSISKIKKLKTLKGFHCSFGSKCKGYEVFWINKNSKTKEYDWQGLIVIFEKYHGTWYIVGLLRDRWTV